jgi:hypothetical protein
MNWLSMFQQKCTDGGRWLTALAVLLLAAFGLVACNGSGAGGTGASATGVVNIGLTDAAGDFVGYTVDVTSLTLSKANGTVVETLPLHTRVDFAQYVDMTEFLTGATVPAGNYVSATLQVDYSHADIEVDNGDGGSVQVAPGDIRDANGNPITTLSMTVKLDNARHLVIAPGIPALLDLDFNLAASNQVDMSDPAKPVLTVSPMLLADVDPDLPKPHRVRGPLDAVDTQSGSFTLALRPFRLLRGDFGRMTFLTNNNTVYEINQTTYQGSAGLLALAQLPRFTGTIALGGMDSASHRFVATEVYAGSSVPFGTSDVVSGNVTARNGNTLTLRGAALVRSTGSATFRDTVSVTLDPIDTKVTGQTLAGVALDTNSISVGQRVTVLGTLDTSGAGMDATHGLVRLLVTQLNGNAIGTEPGRVTLALDRIDGRPIAQFNFTGTGVPGQDADPNAYQISTASLDLNGIGSGTPLKLRGFVQPFGQATATDDFHAMTLIDVSAAPATLTVGWPALTATPFDAYTADSMMLVLTDAGARHDVLRAGVESVLALTATPTARAADPARGLFAIGYHGTVQIYTQFGEYQQALQADLAAGQRARAFFGTHGMYDDATQVLTTRRMLTILQ